MFNQEFDLAKTANTLTLAPFCGIPKIYFDRVKKGTTARRTLLVNNPSKDHVEVSFIKYPQEEKGFSYSWVKRVIHAEKSTELEIIWNPIEAGKFYENVSLQYGRKFKASFSLNGNCVDVNKKIKRSKGTPKKFIKRTLNRKSTPFNTKYTKELIKKVTTISTPSTSPDTQINENANVQDAHLTRIISQTPTISNPINSMKKTWENLNPITNAPKYDERTFLIIKENRSYDLNKFNVKSKSLGVNKSLSERTYVLSNKVATQHFKCNEEQSRDKNKTVRKSHSFNGSSFEKTYVLNKKDNNTTSTKGVKFNERTFFVKNDNRSHKTTASPKSKFLKADTKSEETYIVSKNDRKEIVQKQNKTNVNKGNCVNKRKIDLRFIVGCNKINKSNITVSSRKKSNIKLNNFSLIEEEIMSAENINEIKPKDLNLEKEKGCGFDLTNKSHTTLKDLNLKKEEIVSQDNINPNKSRNIYLEQETNIKQDLSARQEDIVENQKDINMDLSEVDFIGSQDVAASENTDSFFKLKNLNPRKNNIFETEKVDIEKINKSSDKINFQRYRDEIDDDEYSFENSKIAFSSDGFFNSTQTKSDSDSNISLTNSEINEKEGNITTDLENVNDCVKKESKMKTHFSEEDKENRKDGANLKDLNNISGIGVEDFAENKERNINEKSHILSELIINGKPNRTYLNKNITDDEKLHFSDEKLHDLNEIIKKECNNTKINNIQKIQNISETSNCDIEDAEKMHNLENVKNIKRPSNMGSIPLVKSTKLPVNDLHDPDAFLNEISLTTSIIKYNWTTAEELSLKEKVNFLLAPQNLAKSKTNTIDKIINRCKTHIDSEMNNLREKATHLFRSQDLFKVISKIINIVDNGKLTISQDKNVHNSINMQQHILTLLLNYNPIWLRLGLETIFEEAIMLKSKSDINTLTEFAMNKYFRNPHLLKKHKSPSSPKYVVEIKKHILRKFLMLIYFLDCAKNHKIMQHDPCLFRRNSGLKESKAILLAFTSKYLTAVRDVVKMLQTIGLNLTHKQGFIHEYNYAAENLQEDFKDGVRLVKLLDVVLSKNSLELLRVPAISRLQKVHNVKVGFDLLMEAGCSLDGILVKDVVGGNRVKTLSLLMLVTGLRDKYDVAGAF